MPQISYPSDVQCLADYLENIFVEYAQCPAYTALGHTLSFADIDRYSAQLASYFVTEMGLKAGDRIAIQLPNLLQNPIAVYAALRAGLVVVNTNPLYTEREMKHQFNDSGATALVILDAFADKYHAIAEDTPIQHLLVTSPLDMHPNQDSDSSFARALTTEPVELTSYRQNTDLDSVALLQYTGGTTGVSKGAALTHKNVLANSLQTLDRLGANFKRGEEVVVCPLPLYHIYAFTVCMMTLFAKGSHTLLIPNPRDIDSFITALEPIKFSVFAGINTLFVGLGMQAKFTQLDFSKLHLTISGGTALTEDAANLWHKVTGCTITEGYGLSETAPVVAFNFPGKEELGSVGPELADTEVALLDSHNVPIPEGEAGEIAVRGPQVMAGYWNRPDETAKVMTPDGYFKTGDIGIRTASGAVKIVDRLKDLIIVSGFNVYPNEIENVLASHPAVLEAAVIGQPDDKTGERVCAFVTLNTDANEQEILDFCRTQLTGYKVPKALTILEELPKSTVGKLLRRELRQV